MKKNFTQVPNEVLNNPNLSALSKVIYSQFLSNKADFKPYLSEFVKNRNKEGMDAHKSAIRELKKAGLLLSKKLNGKKGQFSHEYTTVEPGMAKPTVVSPTMVEPTMVKPTTNNTNPNNINPNNTEEKNINKNNTASGYSSSNNFEEAWELITEDQYLEPIFDKEEIPIEAFENAAEADFFELKEDLIPENKSEKTKKENPSTLALSSIEMDIIMDELGLFDQKARERVKNIFEKKKHTIRNSSIGFFKTLAGDELKSYNSKEEQTLTDKEYETEFNRAMTKFNHSNFNDTSIMLSCTYKSWLTELSTHVGKKRCLELLREKPALSALMKKSPFVLDQHTRQVVYDLNHGKTFADSIKDLERIDTNSTGKRYL